MRKLGKWAVIDIETTGMDESYDEIIDLGFLEFEGTKLVRKYSSLVKTDKPLSHFIQKLTGIVPKMMKDAPLWQKVEPDLLELENYSLIAHNAAFEEKFLSPFFSRTTDEHYVDTLSFFGLVYPEKQKLGLEGLIVEAGITDAEIHRGYEDSLDLLKMILFSLEHLSRDKEKDIILRNIVKELDADHWGWPSFFAWTRDELLEIADQIDFDVIDCVDQYIQKAYGAGGSDEESHFLETSKEFSSSQIQKLLGEDSPIIKVFPQFQPRKSQLQMSLRVGQAFGNSIHSVIQAPTGTGKTLAYMVPASLFVRSGKGRVLISTGTKTLQEQLISKDIPKLRQVIGDEFGEMNVVRLVGSSNHMCELLFEEKFKSINENQESLNLDHAVDYIQNEEFTKAYMKMIFFHNSREPNEKRILVDQVPYILKRIIPGFQDSLQESRVNFRSCIGSKCPHSQRCSYMQGLKDAKDADIIIGNHSLMLHWPRGVERPEHVIVDEAHRIEHEASEAYSLELSQRQLESILGSLERSQGLGALFYLLIDNDKEFLVEKVREQSQPITQKLLDLHKDIDLLFESFFKKGSRFSDIYWNELPMIEENHFDDTGRSLRRKLLLIKACFEQFVELLSPFVEMFEDKSNRAETWLMANARFENLMVGLEESYNVLTSLLDTSEGYCRQLKYHSDSGYLMRVTPIDIGKKVKEELLEASQSVVFTSATLANKDGTRGTLGVNWMTGYNYLSPERRFQKGLYLDAVFDYKAATRVFLATDTPNLNSIEFIPEICSKLTPVIKDLGGKTLMLFSSRKRFEQATEVMLQNLDGDMNVYIQGMGAHVVESFKNDERSILMGMESFGEGIDVPGDSLQLVYIDKVPDVRLSLLTNERRTFFEQSFGNEFVDYYLAQRTRSLHQKLGRLLRRESDRGAIIVTDSRLNRWKNRTVGQFRGLMEPYNIEFCKLSEACRDAVKFIQQQ